MSAQFEDYYRKVHPDAPALGAALLEMGVRCLPKDAGVLVLDFDATDDPLHGRQEGRFFHAYYDAYCYLPLFCFCGDVVLWAQLRTADGDASDGTLEALAQIVAAIRARMPGVKIPRASRLGLCARSHHGLVRGAERSVLLHRPGAQRAARSAARACAGLWRAHSTACAAGRACGALRSSLIAPWRAPSRARRGIGKAEVSSQGDNPRFIVTNIPVEGLRASDAHSVLEGTGGSLYEELYCERGQAENRIKQRSLDLQSDRTPTHWLSLKAVMEVSRMVSTE